MQAWYKVATPRKEVREGRSFNPDEFGTALEQVVAGTAPEDHRKPDQFFAHTCFTRALREHAGMVLRRLAGYTDNTAPVLTLVAQFGGGKTHTLTALFLWTLQATDGEGAGDAGGEEEDEDPADDDEDEGSSGRTPKGFTLVFDVVRRFAQPLGIELPKWEGRVIETKKGVVRLLPVAERAKQLFGEDGASAVATRLEQEAALGANSLQGLLFPEMEAAPRVRGARGRRRRSVADVSDEKLAAPREATTLDRVHAAMLLQASGRTNALRALLEAEQERGPDFLRLANALSALYPRGSEEKRLLDAMLLAVPR